MREKKVVHSYTLKTGLLAAVASCNGCDWSYERRNAVGVAANHAKYTGHEVHVEVVRSVVFEPKGARA